MKKPVSRFRYSNLPTLLLSVILLSIPTSILAQDKVLFCFNDWPPYAVMSDGKPSGISVKIIREAGRMLGKEIRFLEMAWNDCLQKVKDGEIDAVVDAAKRDEYLQGPTSFSLFTDTFWVNNNSKIKQYSDMSGGKIGLVSGYSYNDRLMAELEILNLEIVYAEDDATNIRHLSQGQLDSIIADLASTFLVARQQKLSVHPILPPYSVDRLYLSFNLERSVLQRKFDQMFAKLLERGFVDEIYKQYIGTSFSSIATSN